ncbi:Uncharacterised protein [uncultured archaeon]|nr:Uncharacterised protein [uncultured archaeon]
MEEGEATSIADAPEEPDIIDEVVETIRQAAQGQEVTLIRLEIGKELSISKVKIAKRLNAAFPKASVEMKESKSSDSIVVKDIEVA